MIVCPKCNFDNELGRIFCHQCGQKLDINQIKPPSRGGKSLRKKKEFRVGRMISWVVRLLILGALIGVVYLIAQVPSFKPIDTVDNDLASYYEKRQVLENAIARKKEAEVTFTQAEINRFVDTLKLDQPTGAGLKMSATDLQIEFEKDATKVIIVGKVAVGDSWEKTLLISYTGTPGASNGNFTFKPVAAQIGQLPIPLFVLENTGLVEGYFKQLFGGLSEEKRMLDAMTSITSDIQTVVLTHKPPAATP